MISLTHLCLVESPSFEVGSICLVSKGLFYSAVVFSSVVNDKKCR